MVQEWPEEGKELEVEVSKSPAVQQIKMAATKMKKLGQDNGAGMARRRKGT